MKRKRILIVDDEPTILRLLVTCFEMAGYAVAGTRDAQEAQRLITQSQYDALLCDVVLPGEIGGHDMAKWMASHHPAVRVVLMSGYPLDCWACPIAGVCRLLRKPFMPHEALELMHEALS